MKYKLKPHNYYNLQHHNYHLVENSPWPLFLSLSLFNLTASLVILLHIKLSIFNIILSIVSILLIMYIWFKDVNSEGCYLGAHTEVVKLGLTVGFLFFVLTEVMFFISIFWAYLHLSLSPAIELGSEWPPKGLISISPWNLPLLNTILLLSSGAFLTYAHHYYVHGNRNIALVGFVVTIILSLLFTICQVIEFINSPFSLADSAYASSFYFGTTFHGIHVILGTIILIIAALRLYNYYFTNSHSVGIEGAIIYWHIVDVVWLLLFLFFYYLYY